MNPRYMLPLVAACAAMTGTLTAQAQGGLLYSTLYSETTDQCPAPPSLWEVNRVSDEEVQFANPPALGPYDSEQFATQSGWATLFGDMDFDGDYWEDAVLANGPLPGKIDALLQPRDPAGFPLPIEMHSMFFSTRDNVGPGLASSGDIFRVLPGGAPEFFMTAAQVRAALNVPASSPINVDGAALFVDPTGQFSGIYLTLEDDVVSSSLGPVMDGTIVFIPIGAVGLAFSPYDGAMLVGGVAGGSATIYRNEFSLDLDCGACGVVDSFGNPVPAIVDTDGLTVVGSPIGAPPQVWFCGEGLTGCSVLVAGAFGPATIAVLNGRPLGQVAPSASLGFDLGLQATDGSLNGLILTEEPQTCAFVTDTPTPQVGPSGHIMIEAAGSSAPVFAFLVSPAPDAPFADPSIPLAAIPNTACFPHVYFNAGTVNVPPTVNIGNCAKLALNLPPTPGWHLVVQAFAIAGSNLEVSTPCIVDM